MEESSGSVRHKVTSLTQNGDGKLTVNISSIIPEVGTCDMAQWHILIETTADVATEQDIALSFLSDRTDTAIPLPTDAVFRGDTADVTVPLPDGWEFELLDDGMRFWPQEHKDDPLHLYATTGFGVCGTGLRCDTITLGSYEAEQGTYDDHKLWDYIILPKALYSVGDYVILNEGADAWWDDYGDEAMAILADITIFEHVLPKEKAIALAKTVCTISFNRVNATYIAADLTWEVRFYTEDACGGGQTVIIDALSGEALETSYSE